MGIGQQIFAIYEEFFENIDLNRINNICEIGRQNLTIKEKIDDTILNIYKKFNKDVDPRVLQLAPEDNWGIRAKIFYESLGIKYYSMDIDLDEENEDYSSNYILDLNFDKISDNLRNKFDIVTNFGTSEHIFNQLNFFETMHEITATNGFMISEVPCMFGINHGMYKYEPKFFTDLARSNSYIIHDFYLVEDPPSLNFYKWNDANQIKSTKDLYIIAILQKTNSNKFCIPLCENYEMKIQDNNLARYDYNVEGKIIKGDKTRYILRHNNELSHLRKEILIGEIFRRIKLKLSHFFK